MVMPRLTLHLRWQRIEGLAQTRFTFPLLLGEVISTFAIESDMPPGGGGGDFNSPTPQSSGISTKNPLTLLPNSEITLPMLCCELLSM